MNNQRTTSPLCKLPGLKSKVQGTVHLCCMLRVLPVKTTMALDCTVTVVVLRTYIASFLDYKKEQVYRTNAVESSCPTCEAHATFNYVVYV